MLDWPHYGLHLSRKTSSIPNQPHTREALVSSFALIRVHRWCILSLGETKAKHHIRFCQCTFRRQMSPHYGNQLILLLSDFPFSLLVVFSDVLNGRFNPCFEITWPLIIVLLQEGRKVTRFLESLFSEKRRAEATEMNQPALSVRPGKGHQHYDHHLCIGTTLLMGKIGPNHFRWHWAVEVGHSTKLGALYPQLPGTQIFKHPCLYFTKHVCYNLFIFAFH